MRDTALKSHLLKRIRPLADQLARDLAELTSKRIEAALEHVNEAFEVALSAYQSNDGEAPSCLVFRRREDTPADAPAPTTPESAPSTTNDEQPESALTDPAKLPLAGRRPCGCAGRGPHRTSCELATKRKARSLGLIGLSKLHRRSIIAERARRQPARAEEPEEPNPSAGERWSKERLDREQAEAEAHKLEGALPEPVVSFERQAPGGSFLALEPPPEAELDFGGQG